MIDARLKILALSGYGDIRDAGWTAVFSMSSTSDFGRAQKRRVMRKAYLARYLHLPLSTWDNMTRSEIDEYIDATNTIMGCEAEGKGIPL